MSYHDMQYLNSGNILVGGVQGLTNPFGVPIDGGWRRPAWWYDKRMEDPTNPTHFPDYLPIDLVKQKLFGWTALESAKLIAHVEYNGKMYQVPVTTHKAMIREDRLLEGMSPEDIAAGIGSEDSVLSIMSDGYEPHQLKQTFITNTAQILGGADSLGITGAGLLKWGRVAYMEVSIPETLHNTEVGFGFRPNLLIYTSFDGSLKTKYTRTITAVVCDNTLQWAIREAGDQGSWELKHAKGSAARLPEAREALGIIDSTASDFEAEIVAMSRREVTAKQWTKWLDLVHPIPEVKVIDGKAKTNSQTIVINKRDRLTKMYTEDPRASVWTGTDLGVAMAFNTDKQHNDMVRGTKALDGNATQARVEKNIYATMKGTNLDADVWAMEMLAQAKELVPA
jgi:phage/plasmid-like protein (TIGR03299 family)